MTDTQASPESNAAAAEPAPVDLPWADVQPEHFKMLRLAPLTTDRATGGRPLRFVQFGYAERNNKERSLLRMSIQLPAQRVRKEQNQLDMWVDHTTKRVHFGPESGLQVEPWNRGIGRFLVAQAAIWAQKKWSHYRVDGAALQNKDALNEDTRLRRDHFLRVQGFDVVYADPQHLKGSYKDLQVGELLAQWNTEKLQFVEILEAAQMLQNAEQNLMEQEVKLRQQEERVSKFKREDSGLRFTITCLVAFAMFQAGLLIWIATHR
ncbi:hypothetical protein [Pseudomonas gingeri]|uniref:Uncharacterized protein n=1 Tax=Pseudomonas gingeri TaxID=117681 RepID=A0A7Y7YCK6_9PSED|nr:hypothetical protein [Pseudomonas gingeri]NWA03925.1 hypothetical protein [Pseudomonas gingeri]NWA12671.1 hypothetical protein [Pseudomonas gingeri]NWA58912.1 hypothetical protein [Pseudomonas gingeri]NWA94322.1 hypothetical protein [Pseudomonas gingeri]NWB00978.1 hypothetical protein [Pseudomonas gingeri]